MNNSLEYFVEPYTIRKISFFGWYDVVFEDETIIFGVRGKREAERVAAALNGAYNLGRSFEIIRQEVRKVA